MPSHWLADLHFSDVKASNKKIIGKREKRLTDRLRARSGQSIFYKEDVPHQTEPQRSRQRPKFVNTLTARSPTGRKLSLRIRRQWQVGAFAERSSKPARACYPCQLNGASRKIRHSNALDGSCLSLPHLLSSLLKYPAGRFQHLSQFRLAPLILKQASQHPSGFLVHVQSLRQ